MNNSFPFITEGDNFGNLPCFNIGIEDMEYPSKGNN